MKFTKKQFDEKYPDEETCLDEIFQNRFGTLIECPKCYKKVDVENHIGFSRVEGRKCYSCQWCAYQIHPLADTIFHKSETSLRSWFYAIWLFSNSKNGVAAKELERQLGVSYKCAWRMAKQIRLLFVQTQSQLHGIVEVDETYIGGRESNKHFIDRADNPQSLKNKTAVLGMAEREGRIVAQVVSSNRERVVRPIIRRNVKIGTKMMSDEYNGYINLKDDGYKHKRVNHAMSEYVRGSVHTNTIEGFWSQLKRSINGTYHAVSPKYLQNYVNEFSWRYSKRHSVQPLFYPMMKQAGRPVL